MPQKQQRRRHCPAGDADSRGVANTLEPCDGVGGEEFFGKLHTHARLHECLSGVGLRVGPVRVGLLVAGVSAWPEINVKIEAAVADARTRHKVRDVREWATPCSDPAHGSALPITDLEAAAPCDVGFTGCVERLDSSAEAAHGERVEANFLRVGLALQIQGDRNLRQDLRLRFLERCSRCTTIQHEGLSGAWMRCAQSLGREARRHAECQAARGGADERQCDRERHGERRLRVSGAGIDGEMRICE
eukprot:4781193-Pleurochrysis_carterae.AAC.5